MSLTRARPANPIRAALQQAMLSPRVQQAVTVFVNALVDEGEAILKERYAGETLRLYTPKHAGLEAREARKRRVKALAAAPSSLTPEQIAPLEGISARRVRQILAESRV